MKRKNNIELLRIVACFMVIMLHVTFPFVISKNFDNTFSSGNFISSFTRYCVPLFVMISGYFILNDDKNSNIKYFWNKSYNSIVIPTIIWAIIYSIYILTIDFVATGGLLNLKSILIQVIAILNGKNYYHLWYMYMAIGLYLIAPLLVRLRQNTNKYKFLKISCVAMILGILTENLSKDLFWGIKFISYMGYFMIGYCVREFLDKLRRTAKFYISISLIISCSIFVGTEIISKYKILENNLYLYGNLTPLVIMGSIIMFIGFVKLDLKKDITFISKHTFNIYLIHAGVLSVISIIIEKLGLIINSTFIYTLSITFITFFISLILSVIWIKICKFELIKKLKRMIFYNKKLFLILSKN